MVFAVIAAGGKGLRFGGDIPKQFCSLNGKPVILHTVEVFSGIDSIEKIIVCCPPDRIADTKKLLCAYGKVTVVPGGRDRNESVMNGIECVDRVFGLSDGDIVVTHDAVRPFVTEKIIIDTIAAAEKYGAAVAAVAETDTVIEVADGFITSVPDRSRMYRVQTPQTFHAKKLMRLYYSLSETEKKTLTDCSKIYVFFGEKVTVVEGSNENIKITFPEDIK